MTFTQHDAAIWHTRHILGLLRAQRWADLPRVVTAFPPQLGEGEQVLAQGDFALMTHRTVGNGTYMHQSGFFFATGAIGIAASALFAGTQALGNSSRRKAAAAASTPRWVVDDVGCLHVSTHGFYLDTPHALLSWAWQHVRSLEMAAPGIVRLRGDSTNGPVHWMIRSDWAELLFVLWAVVCHPDHPQLGSGAWIPPGWHARDAARAPSVGGKDAAKKLARRRHV